jgi:putative transcriptional regulator
MTIHNKIRELREIKQITQEDLAKSVGVSRQTIIAIEKGNYEPSLGLAIKLARCFKVSIEELFQQK